MRELRSILAEIGLSKYKIETYISLLKLESGTIQQIAKNSSVPACKLYENLKWLHENGYISLILQKPITYKANDPKTVIKSEIDKRKEFLTSVESEVEDLRFFIPLYKRDFVQIVNSRTAFFRKLNESINKSKKSIYYLAGNWRSEASIWRLLKKKHSNGVNILALGPINTKSRKDAKWIAKAGVKIRNCNLKTTRFTVIDTKTVILRLRKDEKSFYSVWVDSEVLAEILENYFEIMWKKSKKMGRN